MGVDLGKTWSLSAAAENFTDKEYEDHRSTYRQEFGACLPRGMASLSVDCRAGKRILFRKNGNPMTLNDLNHLTLTTPALLFSAISLILLAYTNRFLSYAALVRQLHDHYLSRRDETVRGQIDNLRRRLYLIRAMQVLGISSLLLCVLCMFLVYINAIAPAEIVFGTALLLLIASLGVSIREIIISIRALELHLSDMQ